jgi:hypothetical protein
VALDACPFQGVQIRFLALKMCPSVRAISSALSGLQRCFSVSEILLPDLIICVPFQECRKLQNFSSMSAIITALQCATRASSTTSQLVLTRESKLLRSEKQLLCKLEEILNPIGDHYNYHEALRNVGSPPLAIPWLGTCTLLSHLHPLAPYRSPIVVTPLLPLLPWDIEIETKSAF